jgi:hypothetical protein
MTTRPMLELPNSTPDPVTASQAKCNRSTERQWGMYARHRRAIERLIVPDRRGGSICVLGAGNCNDLDLPWLTDMYADVHLVDLDADALRSGIARQIPSPSPSLHQHAPFDLTAVAPRIAAWSKTTPSPEQIDAATRDILSDVNLPWPTCDVALSPCVLTQTINPARDALRNHYEATHPSILSLRSALRSRHLRTIAHSLKPGGRGVLAIDLISSEKFPDLPRIPDDQLDSAMRRFIDDKRGYRGLDPANVTRAIREDPGISNLITPPQFMHPWLWHLGLRRSFLVYAATFTRRR